MFKKATKSQIKIRLAISGASGSGKTYSSLAIASHLGNSIAVIDTERGSSNRYAGQFSFDVAELTDHHPAKYIELIKMAEQSYDTIIIDSLSHAWFAELELAGSNFNNWSKVRPIERKLIDAMTGSLAHVIATMRSKTEWVLEETTNKHNKTTMSPRKIGMAPIQTSGIEYEFDLAGELDYNHLLTISKSRCPDLSGKTFLNPGGDLAQKLKAWIEDSKPEWADWKTEEDALIWAGQQLPDIELEVLRREFANLTPTNGKKAPAWVARIEELKHPF